ncbi:MAG: hypothetical protein KGK03_06960 [Candidatus Omnitrophica bacterium]|nr:hypothetical protein [Candidatus Omnitrophota bacterium]
MKPDVKTAMENLIRQARQTIPFNLSFSGNCEGRCEECPYKLLEYLDMDLANWEYRLKKGDIPTLGELHVLGSNCKDVYAILIKQGLIHETTAAR